MIERPFQTLRAWAAYFERAEIPVLTETLERLAYMRDAEDSVSAKDITRVVLRDPLMALRVIRHIEENARRRKTAEITTIEHAVMMMGISPFFRTFDNLPLIETQLADHALALEGLQGVIQRSRQAASFARDWAIIRHDADVEEVVVATLLHDLPELLLWTFAPTLALTIQENQRTDPALRSTAAQLSVLGIRLNQLQVELAHRWHLPGLIVRLMDDFHAEHPRVRNVILAVDLARHLALGKSAAAIPNDLRGIASLLHLSTEQVETRLAPFLADEDEDAPGQEALQPNEV